VRGTGSNSYEYVLEVLIGLPSALRQRASGHLGNDIPTLSN
jgi:hypothetical protein